MNLNIFQNRILLLVIVFSVLSFILAYFAPVSYESSDPAFTLLTSQAIIEHGTIKIDAYKEAIYPHHFEGNRRIRQLNGNYYHYSIGTGIFSTPVVWVANFFGRNLTNFEDTLAIQNLISAILTALVFVTIYKLCNYYLPPTPGFVIATVSMLGSILMSTMGSALWNVDFAILFIMLALLHLARHDTGQIPTINPYWLGFLLFAAFLARPTAAFFIISVFVYFFLKDRQFFWKVTALTSVFLALFALFFWLQYSTLLPSYYSPVKLIPSSSWLEGVYGNLFSPSRGVFIYNPFLILVVGISIWRFHNIRKYTLFWLSAIWFGLHLIAVAGRIQWWGGNSYGPRFLADVMPAFVLITILLWREIGQNPEALLMRRVLITAYLALGILGIFINSYQGLYNISTKQWSIYPPIDENVNYVFDWKYPQFLASEKALRQRNLEHHINNLKDYSPGETITFAGDEIAFATDTYAGDYAIFHNWHVPEAGWRWSKSASPQIEFKSGLINREQDYILEIVSASLTSQQIGILLNGTNIGYLKLVPFAGSVPTTSMLSFSGALLKPHGLNKLELDIPETSVAQSWESRTIGLAFISLKIYPAADKAQSALYIDGEGF